MIPLVALAAVLTWQGSNEITSDPTFKELSKLVGGHWVNTGSQGVKVVNRFRFEVGGKLIRSDGTVTMNGKTVLYMHANLGWDKSTKSVSYVDLHDNDTVYTGHVTLDSGVLIFNFGELHNPKAHYTIKMKFIDNDHYEGQGAGGDLKMIRIKD
jgi:hypothetical protein